MDISENNKKYKITDALKRAQKKYYEKNKSRILSLNNEYYKKKPQYKKYYINLKNDPVKLAKLKEYYKLKYIEKKEQRTI